MVSAKSTRILQIVAVVCLAVIVTASVLAVLDQQRVLTEKDFPLEVDLPKHVYNVGENISFTVSIINRSGRDINMSSNTQMPCVFFHNINDTIAHGEISPLAYQIVKANDKVSRVFEYEAAEPGTYILDAHYQIGVNGAAIQTKLDDITIEVR